MTDITQRLSRIQKALKAPKEKNQNVSYKSRSAEQILEAAKDVLEDGEFVTCYDEIYMIGDRFYVKATAKLGFGKDIIECSAYAREDSQGPLSSNGKPLMQPPQVTGASSSYARKYALGGLFAIDDSKDDPDKNKLEEPPKEITLEEKQFQRDFMYNLGLCKTVEEVEELTADNAELPDACSDAVSMRTKGLNAGTKFPPVKYGFVNVAEALEFGKLAKKNIDTGPFSVLEEWLQENDHKIRALDTMLKAAVYNKEGSPSERLFKIADERMKNGV